MKIGLEGKSVLITGASKGIGLATARAFAAEGCALHLAARSRELLEARESSLVGDYGVPVSVHALDLSLSDNIVALAKECPQAGHPR
jgi:short-subunit dehydrogenase